MGYRGMGVLPYMGYIGMCAPKGYGFLAVLVINRVLLVFSFTQFKIDQNKNQNSSIDKVQNLGNERR